MKKKVSVLLVLLVGVLLVGCNKTEKNEKTSIKDADSYLKEVMDSKQKFINDDGSEVLLSEYKVLGLFDSNVSEYVLIDLDDDKTNELVVKTEGENYGYVVFNINGDKVYGYSLIPQSFKDLKVDGSFNGISGASETSYYNIEFKDNEMLLRLNASIDTEKGKCTLDGAEVNSDSVQQYVDEYNQKQNVEWIKK